MKSVFAVACGLTLVSPAAAHEERRPWLTRTAWDSASEAERQQIFRFGDDYIAFISQAKTERETVALALGIARQKGFKAHKAGERIKAGDRRYFVWHGKILALTVIGKRPLSEGLRVLGAHIDSVRLDLKQKPLYEDTNLVLLDTQYYGSVQFYQWLSRPLALHGVVVKKNGEKVEVRIGEDPKDPVLVIPDVLKHLFEHVKKEAGGKVPAEKLDAIVSHIPDRSLAGKRGAFRLALLRLLKERYGMEEDDFVSAELSLVPAGPARSVGLDSGLVGGYGQDDRACSYAGLRAVVDMEGPPRYTAITLFVDKEEIGSTGNTGMKSTFFRYVSGELMAGADGSVTEQRLREALSRSRGLSVDVTSAADPHYKVLYDRRNVGYLGAGPVWDQSGVHSEFLHSLRAQLHRHKIPHQVGLFSKSFTSRVEAGTILPYMTQHGMDAADVSIPLLSMHSPFEVTSKADLYHSYRFYKVFLQE